MDRDEPFGSLFTQKSVMVIVRTEGDGTKGKMQQPSAWRERKKARFKRGKGLFRSAEE